MPAYDKNDIQRRMLGAVEALKHDLVGLRTGRASVALLDTIAVEARPVRSPPRSCLRASTAPCIRRAQADLSMLVVIAHSSF